MPAALPGVTFLKVFLSKLFVRDFKLRPRSGGFFLYCFFRVFFCTLDAGLLARSQYSEGPATGHLDTGFSWFPCA